MWLSCLFDILISNLYNSIVESENENEEGTVDDDGNEDQKQGII